MSFQRCIVCHQRYDLDDVLYYCGCGGLLEVVHEPLKALSMLQLPVGEAKNSGVWRFKEAVLPIADSEIVSHPEGHTRLYERESLCKWVGVHRLLLKHEGENPTGSFKDRGMTVAVSQAKHLKQSILACASTGNTSASLAAYGAQAGLTTRVFLPEGKIAPAKLAQATAYGAEMHFIQGDFDQAMKHVLEASQKEGFYLLNSVNPFRLEGQKTILWELFEQLAWEVPDWIVVPGGNLGNTSAFGKAIREAYAAGWISRKPKIAVIQAQKANPFYESFLSGFQKLTAIQADTRASAINIGNPVNFEKAKAVIVELEGCVEEVTDAQIKKAKQQINQSGIGCEPASAATLAGVFKLVSRKIVKPTDCVVCILTGHLLKDPSMLC